MLSVAPGMNLQLRSNGFSYDTYTVEDTGHLKHIHTQDPGRTKPLKASLNRFHFHRVDISFSNANPHPRIVTEGELDYDFHFPNNIRARSYQKVTYKEIYPFIDLVFKAGSVNAEYDFVVRPGGDPRHIAMHFAGATKTELKENKIQILVERGNWNERIPASYSGSKKIPVMYRKLTGDSYGFDVGTYDHKKQLLIDPMPDLIWGTYLGGDLNEWGFAVTTDAAGNVYMGGSSDNPGIATAGAFKSVLDGYSDALLGKFTSDGKPLWITYFGGESEDLINGLAADHLNNIIAVGSTFSKTQIATPGSYKTTNTTYFSGECTAFIAKFTSDGSLLWSTYYGGDSICQSSGVAIDNSNNIYIAAWTNCAVGIATPGAFQMAYGTGWGQDTGDGCVARFTPGGAIVWSTYYGGPNCDRFNGIAIDNAQNLYLSGITFSQSKIATPGSYQPAFGGGNADAFLVRFNLNGARQWATYYGGTRDDYSTCICTDKANNIYIGGLTFSLNAMSSPGTQAFGGALDGFIGKFSPSGQRIWGTYTGGNNEEDLDAIGSDDNNNVYVSGYTISASGIATTGAYQTISPVGAYWTTYLLKYNSTGIKQWGTYYGINGPYGEGEGFALAVSGDYIYVTGETSNTENIATCDAYQKTWNNNQDAFLAKFGPDIISSISIGSDPDAAVCAGSRVNFTATAINAGNDCSYQWYWNGNPVGTNAPLYSNNQFAAMDSVRCTLSKSASCLAQSVSSNSIILRTDPALPVSVTITGPADSICTGEKMVFMAEPINGGTKPLYQWFVNGVDANTDSAVFVPGNLVNGDLVKCLVTHPGACTSDSTGTSNTVEVKVKSIPSPTITISSSANPVCSGEPVEFNATIINGGINPGTQWQVNGIPVGGDELKNSIASLKDGDQVDCLLSANISGCSLAPVQSNILTEIIHPVPVISITGDSVINKGESAQITASATGNISSFVWTPSGSLNAANIWSPLARPDQTTTYSLNVSSDFGCTALKKFTVMVIIKIMIPNAFTPNGDGKNEWFSPVYGPDISEVSFTIYNRWGQLIFEDSGTHRGWDGKMGGIPQPAGTYVWEFRYRSYSGESKILSGTVLLLK
jgi:gliding motility-associated-like protein